MFNKCVACDAGFASNHTLQRLPNGTRFAYDPLRGRLWIVCAKCRTWSLTPIEERWEALEELESAILNGAHLLRHSEYVSLFQLGRVEIIRIGSPPRTEHGWRRFGTALQKRLSSSWKASFILALASIGLATWGTFGFWAAWAAAAVISVVPNSLIIAERRLRLRAPVWSGHITCPQCGKVRKSVSYADSKHIWLLPDHMNGVAVLLPCTSQRQCQNVGLSVQGTDALNTLRKALAYRNSEGATANEIRAASYLVESAGSPSAFVRLIVRNGRRLEDLPRTTSLALEIALNEAFERQKLTQELRELSADWRDAEQIATIVDNELTFVPDFKPLNSDEGKAHE